MRQRFPERSGHARTMSHFDRVAEEMNVSEEHTIIDSKSRSLISSSLLAESKDLRRPCTQSLKYILSHADNCSIKTYFQANRNIT